MKIIAEITRAWAGTENGLVDAIQDRYPTPARISIVCTEAQQDSITERKRDFADVVTVPAEADPRDIAEVIFQRFVNQSSGAPTEHATIVYTYHAQVRALEKRVPLSARALFQFLPWGILKPLNRQGQSIPGKPPIYEDFPLSMSARVDCLVTVLRKSDRPLYTTDLRPYLVQENYLFDRSKFPTSPGFIAEMVEAAEVAGLVSVDRRQHPENPIVSLISPVRPNAVPVASRLVSMPKFDPDITRLRSRSGGMGANAADVAPLQPGELSEAEMDRSRSLVDTQGATESTRLNAPRLNRLFDILKAKGVGPYSGIRQQLYEELEQIAKAGETSCTSIIHRVVISAQNGIKRTQEDKKISWSKVDTMLHRLLAVKRCFLIGDNNTNLDTDEPLDFGKKVKGLAPADWKQQLDGYILEILIDEAKDVMIDDLNDLAVVVYNKRGIEQRQKIENLIGKLLECGRVSWNSSRQLAVVESVARQSDGTPLSA